MINRCIICNQEKENMSAEHIIPDAIGGDIVIKAVCSECNSKLGSRIDCLFTEAPIILILRYRYRIPDKEGKLIDLTKRIKFIDSKGKRIHFRPGECELFPEKNIRVIPPTVEISQNADGKHTIQLSGSNINGIITKIERELHSKNIPFNKSELKEKVYASIPKDIKCTDIKAYYEGEIQPDNYIPCAIKIAYEATYHIFGDLYLDDPMAIQHREFLYSTINSSDKKIKVPNILFFDFNHKLFQPTHRVDFIQCGKLLIADVTIFGGFKFLITVSYNSERYNLEVK